MSNVIHIIIASILVCVLIALGLLIQQLVKRFMRPQTPYEIEMNRQAALARGWTISVWRAPTGRESVINISDDRSSDTDAPQV